MGRPMNMRRALALLMVGMWVWVLAATVLEGRRGHRHDASDSPSPSCGACTLSLGLLEGPGECTEIGDPTPPFPTPRPPVPTAAFTSVPDDHPGRGPPRDAPRP